MPSQAYTTHSSAQNTPVTTTETVPRRPTPDCMPWAMEMRSATNGMAHEIMMATLKWIVSVPCKVCQDEEHSQSLVLAITVKTKVGVHGEAGQNQDRQIRENDGAEYPFDEPVWSGIRSWTSLSTSVQLVDS